MPFPTTKKPSFAQKVSNWFGKLKPSHCTCPRTRPVKTKKHKSTCYTEPIQIPRKYASETKLFAYVGGRRVPYIPSQISQVKEGRKSYDPIEEVIVKCDYCRSRQPEHQQSYIDDY